MPKIDMAAILKAAREKKKENQIVELAKEGVASFKEGLKPSKTSFLSNPQVKADMLAGLKAKI